MKAVVAAFNQEKALVGAFSVITNLRIGFVWISNAERQLQFQLQHCLLCHPRPWLILFWVNQPFGCFDFVFWGPGDATHWQVATGNMTGNIFFRQCVSPVLFETEHWSPQAHHKYKYIIQFTDTCNNVIVDNTIHNVHLHCTAAWCSKTRSVGA